jgi:hypothetical protein
MSTDNYSYEIKKEPTRITRFLWWCAGADEYFLRKSPKQDRLKYAVLGGAILINGLIIALSGGIAFYMLFGPKVLAGEVTAKLSWWGNNFWIPSFLFSFVLGALIIKLDRFINSKIGKGDGTRKITWSEYKQNLPRIIIAIFLVLFISKPLEMFIFKPEIDVQLGIEQQQKLEEYDKLTYSKYKEQIALIDKDIKKIENERNLLVDNQKLAEKEYLDQMQGRSGQPGYGPRAKQLEGLSKEKEQKIIEFDKKNSDQIILLKEKRENKLKEQDHELNSINKQKVQKIDNLVEKTKITNVIGYKSGLFITFILLLIGISPVFFKMIMANGPYENMIKNK